MHVFFIDIVKDTSLKQRFKEEIADKIDGLDWNKFVGNADFYPFKVMSIWIYNYNYIYI